MSNNKKTGPEPPPKPGGPAARRDDANRADRAKEGGEEIGDSKKSSEAERGGGGGGGKRGGEKSRLAQEWENRTKGALSMDLAPSAFSYAAGEAPASRCDVVHKEPSENRDTSLGQTQQPQDHGARWSSPLSLMAALSRAPVVVRLEEGHRGSCEELSLSAGDTMALQGVTQHRGSREVMAYHVRERSTEMPETEEEQDNTEEARAEGDEKFYRLLPYDSLPQVDVCVSEDSSGQAFATYLAGHFPYCNWTLQHQRQELLDKMGDSCYVNASSIITATSHPHHHGPAHTTPLSKGNEKWKLHTTRPTPTPPTQPSRLRAATPGHATLPRTQTACGGVEKEGVHATPPPPPRPPKQYRRAVSVPDFPPSHLRPTAPPPRPPRRSADERLPPPSPGLVKRSEEEEEEDQEEGTVFNMPTFAELFTAGSVQLDEPEPGDDGEDYLEPMPRTVVPDKGLQDKDNYKKVTAALKKMKALGMKVYGSVSKVTAKTPVSSQERSINTTTATTFIPTTTPSAEEEASDSSDDDGDYTEIDESMMSPVFDKPSQPVKGIASKAKSRDVKGDKSNTGKPTKAAVLRPILRVEPHGLGGKAVTSHTTSSLPRQRQGGGKPLTSQSIFPDFKGERKTPHPHPMMMPQIGRLSVEKIAKEEREPPTLVTCPLQDMTCIELCDRLRHCGMQELAQICRGKSVDGLFFCALTDEALRQPPFSLSSFDVDTKLKMVKAGWMPK